MNKLFGVLGNPISHSMSPDMHNDAFKQLEMNCHYHAFRVQKDELKQFVDALRVINISGFNVTIPHKVSIMDFLDEIDEEAKMIGAINTVVNSEGRLIGYNTDGRGFLYSLLQVTTNPLVEASVLVLGAGGAARAVVTAVVDHGVKKLTIANRTTENAVKIKENYEEYKKNAGGNIEVVTMAEVEGMISTFDIIINTTSIGMSPNIDAIPIPLENIKQSVILCDLIYNPLKTKWLQLGEEKGATILNGVGMFVMQGALAFEKWTGIMPNIDNMEKVVLNKLGGKSC